MPDDFDPTMEMGFFPDRYIVSGLKNIVVKGNITREISEEFIQEGAHLYDVLDRYDRLTSYILNREESSAGSVIKWLSPFLKAYGATDHMLYEFASSHTRMMPNAGKTFRYVSSLMPTYMSTDLPEHAVMAIQSALDAPLCDIASSDIGLDKSMFGRAMSRNIRGLAEEMVKLKVPKDFYELNVPMSLKDEDIKILGLTDDVIQEKLPGAGAMDLMERASAMTSQKKAYRMLGIRRESNIDLDCTMYIGSESTDFQSMDLVHEAGGLAISFNGDEYAVRGSNVAIMSEDTTVLSVFASLFADKGPIACEELAENWSRDYIRNAEFPDRNLVDTMLSDEMKLAKVRLVDKKNAESIADESRLFRKKIA